MHLPFELQASGNGAISPDKQLLFHFRVLPKGSYIMYVDSHRPELRVRTGDKVTNHAEDH
jgi:hypothetical protein